MLVVRDPLRLSDHAIVIPRQLAPLLALCDGTRDAGALRAVLMVRFGLQMGPDALERLLAALDQALLFEGERFQQALDHAQAEFRKAPFRSPVLAGASYPADPADLRALLQQYLDGVDDALPPATGGRGLVSPHIDYARGGPLYARVWRRAAEMVRAADLVVVLGTDHSGGPGRITLTRQHYATPFGVLPTAEGLVERLATALGPAQVFAEELHHRHEHSIELAAVWLHHMRQGQPCELLPVLCGSFAHFVQGEAEPADDRAIGAFCDELRQALAARNAVVVAAHRPLDVLFTVAEETGLQGAKAFDTGRLRARLGVGLDAHGEQGTIVVQAPAQNAIHVRVHGRMAHAGVNPQDGINAIRVAAEAIAAMPLGRIDEETTANIGVISGGTAPPSAKQSRRMISPATARSAYSSGVALILALRVTWRAASSGSRPSSG